MSSPILAARDFCGLVPMLLCLPNELQTVWYEGLKSSVFDVANLALATMAGSLCQDRSLASPALSISVNLSEIGFRFFGVEPLPTFL